MRFTRATGVNYVKLSAVEVPTMRILSGFQLSISLFWALSSSNAAFAAEVPLRPPPWQFVDGGNTGIVALEIQVVSETLAILLDIPNGSPLQINNHSAWGALWNFKTNTATPLDLRTNGFCASGHFLSNGSMVSVGGHPSTTNFPDEDGLMSIRIFEPCASPSGRGCTMFDDPTLVHMSDPRWYPTAIRVFDGSLLIVGGIEVPTLFFNTVPVNSFEFFPSKDEGISRHSPFLERSLPANLFPRIFALPDGKIFMAANNQTIIYDMEAKTERVLPDIPNGVRITNPYDGAAQLLPLSPPDYVPEVLVCGGTNASDQAIPATDLSTQDPASDQCSRIVLTEEGITKGWEVEKMLEGRMMPELINLPNGELLIINGAGSGYAAFNGVQDLVGLSNADHPVLTPSLYTPWAPHGKRISNKGMPTSAIPRMYHSGVTLTPMGNLFVAGSNPNALFVNDTVFNSELRAEYLNPPYMTMNRPTLQNVPKKIRYNKRFTVSVDIPSKLRRGQMKVALMDLGFSSHAFHSGSRLVFMDATLSRNGRTLSIMPPPNNRVYPPGPGFLFLTIDDVTSAGVQVMVGSGGTPPLPDEGVAV